jgi:type II secretory pathway pseudopilin PulG
MIVIAIIAILAGVLIPNFVRARSKSQLTACQAGLKSIATALEVYGTENSGHFPLSLNALTPNYLKSMPTCPSVHSDTYSTTYVSASNPDQFTMICGTLGHTGAGVNIPNYPQYTSINGLIEQP